MKRMLRRAATGAGIVTVAVLLVGWYEGLDGFYVAGLLGAAGTLAWVAAVLVFGGNSHGFRMRYGEVNMYGQSLQYPGADVLTKEDFTRLAANQRDSLRKTAPTGVLLFTTGLMLFIAGAVVAKVWPS